MSNILTRRLHAAYTAQVAQLIHTLSRSLSHSISYIVLLCLSLTHTIQMHCPLSKAEFQRQKRLEFFHNLPQTSSNLSFSLQWSNSDVCSSLVQLNFKKLYTHAEYHYCKPNYHKLSLPSVALLSLCIILLTYSVADINSVSMQKGEGERVHLCLKIGSSLFNHWYWEVTWVWMNQNNMFAYFLCVFCVQRCTDWLTSQTAVCFTSMNDSHCGTWE